jgi:hypothetical protein
LILVRQTMVFPPCNDDDHLEERHEPER